VNVGYKLSSEEFGPVQLVEQAARAATTRLRVGTAVSCPILRLHPALVAQAAATCALLMPGRFFLGLGTGENLNEHVVGRGWPPGDARLEMLAAAEEHQHEILPRLRDERRPPRAAARPRWLSARA